MRGTLKLGGAVAVASLAILTAGCGKSAEEEGAARRADCDEQIGEFVKALQDLNARLNVGLAYSDYGTRVGDVSAAYERIDLAELGEQEQCLAAAGAGENAFNSYQRAQDVWSRCVREFNAPNCKRAAMLTRLRSHWSDASSQISSMEAILTQMSAGETDLPSNSSCPEGQSLNENGYCS